MDDGDLAEPSMREHRDAARDARQDALLDRIFAESQTQRAKDEGFRSAQRTWDTICAGLRAERERKAKR